MTVIISFPKDVDRVNRQHERNRMTKEKARCESTWLKCGSIAKTL